MTLRDAVHDKNGFFGVLLPKPPVCDAIYKGG